MGLFDFFRGNKKDPVSDNMNTVNNGELSEGQLLGVNAGEEKHKEFVEQSGLTDEELLEKRMQENGPATVDRYASSVDNSVQTKDPTELDMNKLENVNNFGSEGYKQDFGIEDEYDNDRPKTR